jgi:hypothetical protein
MQDQGAVVATAGTKNIRLNVSVYLFEFVEVLNFFAAISEASQYFFIIESESHIPVEAR